MTRCCERKQDRKLCNKRRKWVGLKGPGGEEVERAGNNNRLECAICAHNVGARRPQFYLLIPLAVVRTKTKDSTAKKKRKEPRGQGGGEGRERWTGWTASIRAGIKSVSALLLGRCSLFRAFSAMDSKRHLESRFPRRGRRQRLRIFPAAT